MNKSTVIDGSEGLENLVDGKPPETRMATAIDSSQRIQKLLNSEKMGRSQRRALVKGLVDGNPPYKPADLKRAGRSQACNVNWRVAEFYLSMARFAFYEVFAETPTFATVTTDFGSPAQRNEWGDVMTAEFDALLRSDNSWDRTNQFSIYDMVLYGCGPMVFQDELDWRNEFVPCSNLIVPDFTPSDTSKWEEAAILKNYLPTELYKCIRNEKEAVEMGWNVEATKQAIMQAHTLWQEGGKYKQWEWHQQMLKNNAFWYGSTSRYIQCVHYYYREFPEAGESEGRITHCVLINPEDNTVQKANGLGYLFQKLRRFECWDEIVHPMYYDNDGGGYHHSVTGLGVKMYSAMEYQNRLICNVADKAFAPKILFRPLTANSDQQLSIVQYAEFGKVPAGFDVVQTPVQSFMEEGVAFNRELTGLISSNLAQYRTALTKDSGNPITAYEAQLRASEQSKLGKTQLNHYYNQLDWLMQEKFRRAANQKLNGFLPGGRDAVRFRHACQAGGVPLQAMRRACVKATRTVGQGSPFMRQQALQQLLAISPMLGESGKGNLISDYIAAVAGQSMVERYAPSAESPALTDQAALATLQVAAAKDGVAPIVGGSQNHYVFARVFLQSGVQAIQSLQQAQDPQSFMQSAPTVIQFLDTIGPSLAQHIQALNGDVSHQNEYKELMDQLKQLEQAKAGIEQQAKQMFQQQQKAAQQNQQRQQQAMTDAQLAEVELQNKIRMQQQKTDAAIRMKQEKHDQGKALADASTASEISRRNVVAASDQALKAKKESATAA
jgi:hypothetical protein